ncbi:uncharacterized protein C3orf67 homolog isoform X1 [Electrophorus electricus]|uniref:uncharacterized protein C3orf67 homolog isoform X1 n=1 Tax=Electrophorus electricus TaxID=8005 RepID=UPI0015CF857E|nr:uncharacterized protein C3orf67 homolog isoform X1 [Electrophorus electricus]
MFQGGAFVEIFSAQGKDPVAKWKLSGGQPSIRRVFDKQVKGFVYNLEGSSQTHKMQLPKDGKMPLVLIQRFVVLQVNVPLGKDFSTELVITDQEHLKRRLYLSTVHKEFSATPLHARIPLIGLRRNIWCNLCIDLGTFTAELFRGAEFLSLDGIVISACCKVRRIFTMRTEPVDCMDRDLYDMSNGPKEEIPKSCQFPPDVQHVTQLVDMERLGQAHLMSATSSESDQAGRGRAASARGPKTQDCSHIAFGSRFACHPPLTARKDRSLAIGIEHRAKTDMGVSILSGRSGNLQPRPPTESASSERETSRRAWLSHSAWKEKQVTRNHGDIPLPIQEGVESSQKSSLHQVQYDCSNVIEGNPSSNPHMLDEACCLDTPGPVSRHLQCQSPSAVHSRVCALGKGNNDTSGTHLQLSLSDAEGGDAEEVFTFSSCPHSAKSGQPFCDPFVKLSLDLKVDDNLGREGERKEACLEDDFIGSEGEEDERLSMFFTPRAAACSAPAPTTPCPVPIPRPTTSSRPCRGPAQAPTSIAAHSSAVSSWRTERGCMAPARCLSPCTAQPKSSLGSRPRRFGLGRTTADEDTGTTISRTSVQEVPSSDLKIHQVRESTRRSPAGSCRHDLCGTPEHEEDVEEELQMLASLRRQQEEEEGGTGESGLSASQLHQCNVSLSMSSDDTSTWTQCIPLVAQQGQYYQKEMNPLQHSNPREWMDILSPPIIHPRQQLTDRAGDHSKGLWHRRTTGRMSFSACTMIPVSTATLILRLGSTMS